MLFYRPFYDSYSTSSIKHVDWKRDYERVPGVFKVDISKPLRVERSPTKKKGYNYSTYKYNR